jgi:hypothetical protein
MNPLRLRRQTSAVILRVADTALFLLAFLHTAGFLTVVASRPVATTDVYDVLVAWAMFAVVAVVRKIWRLKTLAPGTTWLGWLAAGVFALVVASYQAKVDTRLCLLVPDLGLRVLLDPHPGWQAVGRDYDIPRNEFYVRGE